MIRAADFSVKSAQAPRPYRQALIKTIWRGSDRVAWQRADPQGIGGRGFVPHLNHPTPRPLLHTHQRSSPSEVAVLYGVNEWGGLNGLFAARSKFPPPDPLSPLRRLGTHRLPPAGRLHRLALQRRSPTLAATAVGADPDPLPDRRAPAEPAAAAAVVSTRCRPMKARTQRSAHRCRPHPEPWASTAASAARRPISTHGARLAVGETVILLHPPLPLVGASVGKERGCQQNGSLADG